MQASVVGASSRARHRAVDAPAAAAWAQNSSVRQSALREWVFMIPPASLTSLPMCPTKSTALNPSAAAMSSASPMKLEHRTTGTPSAPRPFAARKSAP